jgi:hypothetical protein
VKRRTIVLIAAAILSQKVSWANPPEYLAASREPADQASEQPSPFEEVAVRLTGFRLAPSSQEPFFRDSIFSLEPRFYYRYLDDGAVHEAFAGGGAMILTSGWWRDIFQIGIGGYTTQPLATGRDSAGTGLFRDNGDGFSVLGQAWAKLKLGSATATLFRQEIDLPFINGDDTRMIPNLFEAYRVDVEPVDIFRLGFAYVTREKSKTSAEFRPMSEVAGGPGGIDRGTSIAGFLLGKKDESYIGAINELTWDLLNIFYAEASRTWKLSDDLQLRGEIQFIDQQSVGDALISRFATQLYGATLIASYRSAVLSFSFTSVADGADIRDPFGGVPAFNSIIISDFDRAGENACGVGLSYDFERIGLKGVKMFADYARGELPADQHEDEIDITGDYRIDNGPLKNFWLRLRYAHNWESNQPDTDDFRVIVNYTFTF